MKKGEREWLRVREVAGNPLENIDLVADKNVSPDSEGREDLQELG